MEDIKLGNYTISEELIKELNRLNRESFETGVETSMYLGADNKGNLIEVSKDVVVEEVDGIFSHSFKVNKKIMKGLFHSHSDLESDFVAPFINMAGNSWDLSPADAHAACHILMIIGGMDNENDMIVAYLLREGMQEEAEIVFGELMQEFAYIRAEQSMQSMVGFNSEENVERGNDNHRRTQLAIRKYFDIIFLKGSENMEENMKEEQEWYEDDEEWKTYYKGYSISVYDVEKRLFNQLGEHFGHEGFEYEIWNENRQYDSLVESDGGHGHFGSIDEAMDAALETADDMKEEEEVEREKDIKNEVIWD